MEKLDNIELQPIEVNLDTLDIDLNYLNVDLKPISIKLKTLELPEDFLNLDLSNSLKDINLNNFQ